MPPPAAYKYPIITLRESPVSTAAAQHPPLTLGTVLLTLATATGMLLAALDANIVGTAMPTIVSQLGGLDLYSWVFSLYALTSTVAIPIFGRLSDIYGRKRLYLGGMGLFVVASVLCGFAQTMPQLIAGRALQGLGGAAIFALTFTIIGDLHPPERRGQFQGITSSMWAIAALIGPAIGAVIVETIGWRWVFFVNVPVSLIPLVSLGIFLKERRRQAGRVQVDALGAASLAAGIFALLYGLLLIRQAGQQLQAALLLGASAALLVFFVWYQTRVSTPTIPLALFRRRMFALGAIASIIFGWVAFSLGAFVPLLAQAVTGGSAINAGAALTPMIFGWSISAAVAGPLIKPLGYRNTSFAGFALIGVGYLLMQRVNTSSALTDFVVPMAIAGAGCGICSACHILAVQNSVDPRMLGVATSLVMFFRNVGNAVGVGVMGALQIWQLESRFGGPVPNPGELLAGGGSTLSPEVVQHFREALTFATRDVFLIPLVLIAGALVASAMMTSWSTPVRDAEPAQAAAVEAGRG